jgi:hypothetical protein
VNKSILKSPLVKLGLTAVVLVVVGAHAYLLTPPTGYNNGYQPEQPIPFDHTIHAGKYQISCQYCHANADKSRHATVPALNVCMNCHSNVATDKPLIQRMKAAYEAGESIPWVKVNMLPDFVKFNHKRHVAKGVQCQTCHGPVETMQTYYQHTDLSMGWCIECHRKPEHNANISCDTCHY